jgi:hypothetical protein
MWRLVRAGLLHIFGTMKRIGVLVHCNAVLSVHAVACHAICRLVRAGLLHIFGTMKRIGLVGQIRCVVF